MVGIDTGNYDKPDRGHVGGTDSVNVGEIAFSSDLIQEAEENKWKPSNSQLREERKRRHLRTVEVRNINPLLLSGFRDGRCLIVPGKWVVLYCSSPGAQAEGRCGL